MNFRIVPIAPEVADYVRSQNRSPQYGHPASIELARGYGPCRQCLRVFRQGEEDRLLFTYNPVTAPGGIPQPGPVFIHKDPCKPFDREGIPEDLRRLPLFLEAFGGEFWKVRRTPLRAESIEDTVRAMLADPGVEHLQLRNAEAGCFIARIERLGN